jgi:hypothetical protein
LHAFVTCVLALLPPPVGSPPPPPSCLDSRDEAAVGVRPFLGWAVGHAHTPTLAPDASFLNAWLKLAVSAYVPHHHYPPSLPGPRCVCKRRGPRPDAMDAHSILLEDGCGTIHISVARRCCCCCCRAWGAGGGRRGNILHTYCCGLPVNISAAAREATDE